jgi:hypothetical protein
MAEGSLPALQNILMELEKDPAFLKLELNNEGKSSYSLPLNSIM